MKRADPLGILLRPVLAVAVLLLILPLSGAFAQAQSARSVIVVPFEADDTVQGYGLGLATALQRSLNTLDAVFSPAVGDVALVVQRAAAAERPASEVLLELFDADVLVGGRVRGTASGLSIDLSITSASGPVGGALTIEATRAEAPAEVADRVVARVLDLLELGDGADRRAAQAVAAQTPTLPSLGAVALASSRIPGVSLQDLEAAAQLDAESSWVQAEYARALALAGRLEEAVEVSGRAVELLPEDAEAWTLRGVVLTAAGERDGARTAFEEALRLNPSHAVALGGLAGLEADREATLADLQRAVDIYPRLLEAQLQLASLQPNAQRALQVLRQASGHLPESVALHRAALGQVARAGDEAGMVAYLREVLADPLTASPAIYALAGDLPASQIGAARGLIDEGKARFPDSPLLTLAEGRLLLAEDRFEEAEAALAPLLAANPASVEIANALAIAQARQGKTDEAAATFEGLDSANPTLKLNLAQLYLEVGKPRAALTTLEALLAASPDDPDINAYYGVALGRTGRVDEGLAALDRALELAPDFAFAARAKALLEQQRDFIGDSSIRLEGAAAEAFDQGLFALEQENFQEAADAFGRARGGEGEALAAFYQGYALQLSGRVRDALEAYQTAVESFPDNDVVLNNLGYAYLQLGRFDRAIATLDGALAANPSNARVHLNLGLTYYGLGRYTDALSAWDRAIELDPRLAASIVDIREEAQRRASP